MTVILGNEDKINKELESAKDADYREAVYLLIDDERNKQIEKGKPSSHTWAMWLMIFTDYVGRVAKALWSITFDGGTHEDVLIPLVKAVSIGVAWLEDIIRYAEVVKVVEKYDEQAEG